VAFALDQNYPNPFNPSTTIQFAIPKQASITLRVYNILGQEVATLVDESKPAGYYEMVWNGHNQSGNVISSGVYFYRFEAKPVDGGDTFASLKKMLMLK
jgi:flagellar hook assembly protein FlgD